MNRSVKYMANFYRAIDYSSRLAKCIFFLLPILIIGRLYKWVFSIRHVWLISERSGKAKSNGFYFFRFWLASALLVVLDL